MLVPRYTHDCDKCVFLGIFEDKDLYHCPSKLLGGSLIAREGNDGPDYSSCPVNVLESHLANGYEFHEPALLKAYGILHSESRYVKQT